ncbi:MAG: histidinol-phosphatase [Defluviitaleaceae bacterium]|nr:histidinol-phosphatase [Defluviitaleaceae bacterium]
MLTNYHTHHYRCGHAKGEIEDYVVEAIKHGYAEIGMSCHVPFEHFSQMGAHRMNYEDLPIYLKEIEMLQAKYPQIKLLKAFECEYFPHIHDDIEALTHQTDYLILAGHYIFHEGEYQSAFSFRKPEQLNMYAQELEVAMKTGLFRFLAHPDVFMTSYPAWDQTCERVTHHIAKAARQYDIPLEVNANGLRRKKQPYPSQDFWSIIATHYPETQVLINADCHQPEFLNDRYVEQARQMAEALQLNVLEYL